MKQTLVLACALVVALAACGGGSNFGGIAFPFFADKAAGRNVLIPNAMLFGNVVINFTPQHEAAFVLDEVIAEIATSTLTERGATRADDRLSESAMEDRKKEGYF